MKHVCQIRNRFLAWYASEKPVPEMIKYNIDFVHTILGFLLFLVSFRRIRFFPGERTK